MVDTELTAVDGTVLGSARIDLTDEPPPRAMLSATPGASPTALADATLLSARASADRRRCRAGGRPDRPGG
jgi:hypothetical protein